MIDISRPNFLNEFKDPAQKKPLPDGAGEFLIGWGDILNPIPVRVWRGSIPGESAWVAGGCSPVDGSIDIVTYGKKSNLLHHRGGLEGTLMHEFAHHLQLIGSDLGVGGWFWGHCHKEQGGLYEKWKGQLEAFYVGSKAWEMTAEVFRVLQGFQSGEEWEKNEEFLEDFREFLGGNSIFSVFMDNGEYY
jgi:hypothetical protein